MSHNFENTRARLKATSESEYTQIDVLIAKKLRRFDRIIHDIKNHSNSMRNNMADLIQLADNKAADLNLPGSSAAGARKIDKLCNEHKQLGIHIFELISVWEDMQ